MCGVIGIYGNDNVVYEIYEGLIALQHRGQDSAGIITYNEMFHLKKGMGLVNNVFNEKNIARLQGNIGIGHVRYPTSGFGSLEDAQPFYINYPFGIAMAHNGNITNYYELRELLEKKFFRKLTSYSDVEVILNMLGVALEKHLKSNNFFKSLCLATKEVFKYVKGSYSVVGIIADYGIFAFRDPYGIKPLSFGKKNNCYAFASESVVFDMLDYSFVRDVYPGELIFIDKNKKFHSKRLKREKYSYPCIFEYVYFARPDSIIDGIGVYEARLRLGEELGKECLKENLKPDVVIPVPDTARAAAFSVSKVLKVDCKEGLIKNRYIPRTFIMPTQKEREIKVKQKLNPIKSEIENKKVLVVDDSIVRGTTSKEIVALLRKAKAKEVYLAITCPPLRFPCVYGIDMMTRGEFIAKKYSIEKIRMMIGADKLIYQTIEGLIKAVGGGKREHFCTACFTGIYPTKIKKKELEKIEKERIKQKITL
ncbi:MAG: amidophosphoribosyltransferase [candidate division WOR-3 bacterium]|nr:amidophosphoribosyltransferase [candidate division WOR-3 bacterium]MCX7836827.1 amidophosphoribosyltransferase [candidate division WOR-3 bacterium]MDW8113855.1 amidophosphoribosyltransferase [candidate division WOR-3 bacterium]